MNSGAIIIEGGINSFLAIVQNHIKIQQRFGPNRTLNSAAKLRGMDLKVSVEMNSIISLKFFLACLRVSPACNWC